MVGTEPLATDSQSSAEVNARAAGRAEHRMLIGSALLESRSGATFDNISPATGAGAPLMTTQMAQLDWPLADTLFSAVELMDFFAWERTNYRRWI